MKVFWLISISLLLLSCQKKVYDAKTCEDLSIRAFKGWPKDANEFNKNCQGIEIIFTKEKCQEVLNNFVLNGNTKLLKKEFGERAPECLTSADLEKFQKSAVKADDDNHGSSESDTNN